MCAPRRGLDPIKLRGYFGPLTGCKTIRRKNWGLEEGPAFVPGFSCRASRCAPGPSGIQGRWG